MNFLPWILVALIPGCFNVPVAFKQLIEDCKFLPFFEPYKIPGVWFWAIAQFALPCLVFWFMTLRTLPLINFELVGEAVLFGVGFITLMNTRTDTGFFRLDIKTFYARLVGIAYDLIASHETRRTAAFWTDVEQDLNEDLQLVPGLNFLENYFKVDVSLSAAQKELRQKKVEDVRKKRSQSEQVKAILALMDVRRADLPDVLRRFGCSDDLLKAYFPSYRKDQPRMTRQLTTASPKK